jgi:murein L,D-transpeptidase YafK
MRATRKQISLIVLVILLLAAPVVVSQRDKIRRAIKQAPVVREVTQTKTVELQVAAYAPAARPRLEALFAARQIAYPPAKLAFIAIKDSKLLHVYAAPNSGAYQFITTYPVLGASGVLGPKLREGDYQVPEGIYRMTLEPNTPYHLALRLNYPNEHDLSRAKADKRDNPGSDILIHGSTGSIGCLAMGDPASEDLFILAADTNDPNMTVIISPTDMRTTAPPEILNGPTWLPSLYETIMAQLRKYPAPQ